MYQLSKGVVIGLLVSALSASLTCISPSLAQTKGSDGQPMGQVVETQWTQADTSQADSQKQKEWEAYQESLKQQPVNTSPDPYADERKLKEIQDYNAQMQGQTPAPTGTYTGGGTTGQSTLNQVIQNIPGIVQQMFQPPAQPATRLNNPQPNYVAPAQNTPPANRTGQPVFNQSTPITSTGTPITPETRLRWTEEQVGSLLDRVATLEGRCQNCCAKVYSAPYNPSVDRPQKIQPGNGTTRLTTPVLLKGINNITITSRSTVVILGSAAIRFPNVFPVRVSPPRGTIGPSTLRQTSVYYNVGLEVGLYQDTQSLQGIRELGKASTPLAIAYESAINMSNSSLPMSVFHTIPGVEPGQYFVNLQANNHNLADPGFVTVIQQMYPQGLTVLVIPEATQNP